MNILRHASRGEKNSHGLKGRRPERYSANQRHEISESLVSRKREVLERILKSFAYGAEKFLGCREERPIFSGEEYFFAYRTPNTEEGVNYRLRIFSKDLIELKVIYRERKSEVPSSTDLDEREARLVISSILDDSIFEHVFKSLRANFIEYRRYIKKVIIDGYPNSIIFRLNNIPAQEDTLENNRMNEAFNNYVLLPTKLLSSFHHEALKKTVTSLMGH